MNHNHPVQSITDFLNEQIQYVRENQQDLTEAYISTIPQRERGSQFFNHYISEIEKMLLGHKDSELLAIPKVLIGNKVSVMYEDEGEAEDYVICFPEQANPDEDCISFLSPVGRQLLLKELGESTLLITPSGEHPVKIIGISLV